MDIFNSLINFPLRLYFGAFAWAPPLVGLTVFSALAGAGLLWVFQKTSNQAKIRATKRLVYAHLLELRIFGQEPRVMWSAQKALLRMNLRYIGLMLGPALWMAVPLGILLVHLEAFYGRAPLPIGTETILTVRMRSTLDSGDAPPTLTTPAGLSAETPAVRVLSEQQVSWRIRPGQLISDNLQISAGGDNITKRVEAGGRQRFVSGRRVNSVLQALWNPDESRIGSSRVDWIDIRYPEAQVVVLGFHMHWLVWFTLISMVSALLMRKTFRVVL